MSCEHPTLKAINEKIISFEYEEKVIIETDLRCEECGKVVGNEKGEYQFVDIL